MYSYWMSLSTSTIKIKIAFAVNSMQLTPISALSQFQSLNAKQRLEFSKNFRPGPQIFCGPGPARPAFGPARLPPLIQRSSCMLKYEQSSRGHPCLNHQCAQFHMKSSRNLPMIVLEPVPDKLNQRWQKMLVKLLVKNNIFNIQSVKDDQCNKIVLMFSPTFFNISPFFDKF